MDNAEQVKAKLTEIAKTTNIEPLVPFQYINRGQKQEVWYCPNPPRRKGHFLRDIPFGEEIFLLQQLGDLNGLQLVHPNPYETKEMVRSKKCKTFFEKIIQGETVYNKIHNGLIIQRKNGGADVRIVTGVEFLDKTKELEIIVADISGKPILRDNRDPFVQTKYMGERIQVEIPTKQGCFKDFADIIPHDWEIDSVDVAYEGAATRKKGYLGHSFVELSKLTENGQGVITSYHNPSYPHLVISLSSLNIEEKNLSLHTILPIFTRDNPKK